MRLNHDYIRNILLFIEENLNYKEYTDMPSYHKTPSFAEVLSDEYFMDYNQEELLYAMELLIREKYIQCTKEPYFVNGSLMSADIVGLTWNGHQFLDNVRNDTVWNAVKEKAKQYGQFSIKTLASAAGSLSVALMNDPNAIQNFLQGVGNVVKII